MAFDLDLALVARDQFAAHDHLMCEYYDRNPPYEPGPAALAHSEEGQMVARMREAMRGRRVLEVACGSGWATRLVAQVAEGVVASDLSPARLALARSRSGTGDKVRFVQADAYALDEIAGVFDAVLAIAWFAHVPRDRHAAFLQGLHQRVGKGGVVFLADERYNKGAPRTYPSCDDTYELRQLVDGSQYAIIDNKFDEQELRRIFAPRAYGLEVHLGAEYWWLHYTVA